MNDHVAEPFRAALNAHIAPEPIEAPLPATVRDLRKYRRIESDVFSALAEELTDAGHSIDAGSLAWAYHIAEFKIRRAVERS